MNAAANTNATKSGPSYHTIGSNYEATKDCSLVELANHIRADIKALAIPGLKVSVRISRYSMGRSIDLTVTAAPFAAEFADMLAESSLVEEIVTRRRQQGIRMPWLTDEGRDLHAKLEAIHASYNYDNSDMMTDYYQVRFAGSVSFRIRGEA